MNKLISEEIKYNGPRFNVVQKVYEREDKVKYIRDCVEPGDAVVILPINENNEIVFVKQYREVVGKILLELPAGIIDKGETSEQAAIRELEEETGIKTNNIEFLVDFYASCGYTNEKVYIYVARDFEKGMQHFDDTEEILSLEKINIEDCVKNALDNKFEAAQVNIAILTYYLKNNKRRKKWKNWNKC